MEEVLKVQEKYLGYGEKSSAQTIPSLVMEPSLTPDVGTDLESTSNDNLSPFLRHHRPRRHRVRQCRDRRASRPFSKHHPRPGTGGA